MSGYMGHSGAGVSRRTEVSKNFVASVVVVVVVVVDCVWFATDFKTTTKFMSTLGQ